MACQFSLVQGHDTRGVALDTLNTQPSPDELFANRYPEFDYAVAPALKTAHGWITDMLARLDAGEVGP
jgi:hypothetical protein